MKTELAYFVLLGALTCACLDLSSLHQSQPALNDLLPEENTTRSSRGTTFTLPIHGQFYKSYGSQTVLSNGASIPFSSTVPGTVSTFFSLVNGNVKIHLPGVYLIHGEGSFAGSTQMQFILDDYELWDTVVGKNDDGSVLSGYHIITVHGPNAILRWMNPSGHDNTILAQSNVRVTLLGLDGFGSSYPEVARYGEYIRVNSHVANFVDDYAASETKGLYLGLAGTIDVGSTSGTFLVIYHSTPSEACRMLAVRGISYNEGYVVHTLLGQTGAEHISENAQITGMGIITATYYPEVMDATRFQIRTDDWVSHNPNVGGSKTVYSSLIFIEITDMVYAGLYTILEPSEWVPIATFGGFPLENCFGCGAGGIELVAPTHVRLDVGGKYLVGLRSNLDVAGTYKLMYTSSEVAGSRTQTLSSVQIGGLHLVQSPANYILYVQLVSGGTVTNADQTDEPIAQITMFVIRL